VIFEVLNPVPAITSISETQLTADLPEYTLRVSGTGFVPTSQVQFDGSAVATSLVAPGVLDARRTESDVRGAGTFAITVLNPAPGGGTSNASGRSRFQGTTWGIPRT
jgi:hypothetical protein